MRRRLDILKQNNLTIHDIQHVIAYIKPIQGALEFIYWLRSQVQLIVVSDTFTEFAEPLLEKLGRPTLFCHNLTIDHLGTIQDYNLRQPDAKLKVVEAFQNLNYKVISIGDSYNDIAMLKKAELGILFKPPQNVIDDYPDLPVVNSYDDLRNMIESQLSNN